MDTLRRWYDGGRRTFLIYTKAEADAAGIKYVHWRKAEGGDWALTDDGYVGECLKVMGPYISKTSFPPEGPIREKVFSFARIWMNNNAQLLYEERKATRTYYTMSTRPWAEMAVRSKRGKRFIQAYVMNFMAGTPINWEKLGMAYRPDRITNNPVMRAKQLVNQEVFKKMIREALIAEFKERGVTKGDVIDLFMGAYDTAKAKNNAREMRKVAEDFRDMLDMQPDNRTKRLDPYGDDSIEDAEYDIDDAKTLAAARDSLPDRKPQVPALPTSLVPDPPLSGKKEDE